MNNCPTLTFVVTSQFKFEKSTFAVISFKAKSFFLKPVIYKSPFGHYSQFYAKGTRFSKCMSRKLGHYVTKRWRFYKAVSGKKTSINESFIVDKVLHNFYPCDVVSAVYATVLRRRGWLAGCLTAGIVSNRPNLS